MEVFHVYVNRQNDNIGHYTKQNGVNIRERSTSEPVNLQMIQESVSVQQKLGLFYFCQPPICYSSFDGFTQCPFLIKKWRTVKYLPPAYVVRREGNSFTLLVCSHLGGVPISHNALQHYPECHGADTWGVPISHNALQHYPEFHGVPCQVQWGGTLLGVPYLGVVPCQGVPCWGVPYQGYPVRVRPWGQVRMGVPCWGVSR